MKKSLENKSLRLEDNKGGDIVEIEKLDDNLISVKTGQSCVVSFDCIMPVSLLAGMLSFLALKYGSPLKIAEKIFEHNLEWLAEIKPKIKKIGLFDITNYED